MPDPTITETKAQPHNIDAEQALLGALLLNADIADDVFAVMTADMLYDPVHYRIFATIKDCLDRGRTATPITLKPLIGDDPGLAEIGGAKYLLRLAECATSIVAAPDYARMIRDLYIRRTMLDVANGMAERATTFRLDETADDIIDGVEGTLASLRSAATTDKTISSFVSTMSDAMQSASAAFQRDGVAEISSGCEHIDEITNGWQRGNLIVLGARTSMGKTAVACSTAFAVARRATAERRGSGVLFASYEMEPYELGQRFTSLECSRRGRRIPYSRLANGSVEEDEFRFALEAARDVSNLPIMIVGSKCREFGRLRGAVRQAAKRFEKQRATLNLVVVDYVQLGTASHLSDNKAQEVAFFARELKNLAAEYDCPVLALSQVKREVDDRKNRRPMLSDLRWAGEIEEAANQVGFVYRQSYYDRIDAKAESDDAKKSALIARAEFGKTKMEIIWEKNRGGRIGTSHLWCDLATNRIEDNEPEGMDIHEGDFA